MHSHKHLLVSYRIVSQAMAEASSKRLVNLASQWEKHRVPLVEQYRTLKDSAAGAMVSKQLYLYLIGMF